MANNYKESGATHNKARSLIFLGIVLIAGVIAAAIIYRQANKQENLQSPALNVSRQRAKVSPPAKKSSSPTATGTK